MGSARSPRRARWMSSRSASTRMPRKISSTPSARIRAEPVLAVSPSAQLMTTRNYTPPPVPETSR
ncbi:MAG: hypothetical protein ACYC11_12890, partial [Bellilinea sp.]